MAYQVQMNTIDESGNATPIYPKNRKKDVFVGAFEAASEAILPGESNNETLETSLKLIKAYLTKLKSASYANIANELNDDKTTVPNSKLLYDVSVIANNALPKNGGEISGFITFTDTYNGGIYNNGLIFKGRSGSPSSITVNEYEIKSKTWSVSGGGGTLYGALGSTTLVPLNVDSDNLGHSTRRWSTVYCNSINAQYITSVILSPFMDLGTSLGTSTLRFESLYCHNLCSVGSIKFNPHSDTTDNREVGFNTTRLQIGMTSYTTYLELTTGIIPDTDDVYNLGSIYKRFSQIFVRYMSRVKMISFESETSVSPSMYVTAESNLMYLDIENIHAIRPVSDGGLSLGSYSYKLETVYSKYMYVYDYIAAGGTSCYIGGVTSPFKYIYVQNISIGDGSSYSTSFMISWSSAVSTNYGTDGNTESHMGISMGSSSYSVKLWSWIFDVYTNKDFSSNRSMSVYSDEKVKTFTTDLSNDYDKLMAIFDDIKIRVFKYRYSLDSKLDIGLSAQEFKTLLEDNGIDPFKYGLLNVRYNTFIRRGDNDEDQKFYRVFYSISYEQLHTLALMKIRDIEEKHTSKLSELEHRLKAIESKLG